MSKEPYNEALTIAVTAIAKTVNKIYDKDFIANIKAHIKKHLPQTPKKQITTKLNCPWAPVRKSRKILQFH